MTASGRPHRPTMPFARIEQLREWHEGAYRAMAARTEPTLVECLGRTFTVHPLVFPPVNELLAGAVLAEVATDDRVLDLGTGCGVNAILAAAVSSDVVAVDVNTHAVTCAADNADAHGVSARVTVHHSDVFDAVTGRFDLIIFDPPFRWFPARDILEQSITDEDYRVLTRFMSQAAGHLTAGGRILLHFGTSADIDFLHQLIDADGYRAEVLAGYTRTRDGQAADYVVLRLTPRATGA